MVCCSSINQLESLVKATPKPILLAHSDLDLVLYLLFELEKKQAVEIEQLDFFRQNLDCLIDYIYSQMALIRDLGARE